MSVIVIITPPPTKPNANATAVAAADGSGAIIDANGATVATFGNYADAIAYLTHMDPMRE